MNATLVVVRTVRLLLITLNDERRQRELKIKSKGSGKRNQVALQAHQSMNESRQFRLHFTATSVYALAAAGVKSRKCSMTHSLDTNLSLIVRIFNHSYRG